MTLLNTLNFAEVSPSRNHANNKLKSLRTRFREQLAQQVKIMTALEKGEACSIIGKRRVENPNGEGTIVVEREIRVANWAFHTGGSWYVGVRYGNSPLSLNEEGTVRAIKAGIDYQSVLETYRVLDSACEAGELDGFLTRASETRGRKNEEDSPEEAQTEEEMASESASENTAQEVKPRNRRGK